MPEAYIIDAVRTRSATRRSVAGRASADLGAHVLKALVERTGVDPGAVDDVIMGCSTRSAPRPATSPAPPGSSPGLPGARARA